MNFQLEPVRAESFARHLCGEDGLVRVAHAGGIRQELDARMLDVFEHIVLGIAKVDAFHGHCNHFRA